MKFKKSLVKVLAAFAVAFAGFVTVNTVSSNQVQASTTTTKRNKVVSLAKKQVGKRYVYGATGPSSFDCSGLTSYVYSHAIGKYITRTTYTQVKKGKTVAVSTSRLKKGDLLFWGSKSSPYHVGIYIGGGQYVHAATPSQGVRKQHLSSYFWPSTAKRVI
ncbi:NlpC/P60 family protein [Lactobacillus equicursoris]|uniref:NlpC/P60 family protein n=1 Tax=Lactobacillus equicursoris TaxID=420645 RepID=A0A844FML4_9LACO|nr:C40 family peptidase [Lactobacillus equicursoris]MST79569.1 NlpC/P60 family protein [Lactobacillus equicursoris]